jgi:hypothetical protein
MFESALLIRWSISVVVIILLLIAFYVALRILRDKGYNFEKKAIIKTSKKDKMQIVDQLYIDSKTKILKIKDEDEIITILVGEGTQIKKERSK